MECGTDRPAARSDPPFPQGEGGARNEGGEISSGDLFKLLVYTKYTALSRIKLVEHLDDRKEYLVLQGAQKTIRKMRAEALDRAQNQSAEEQKASTNEEFAKMLMALKRYSHFFKARHCEPCKLRVATDDSTVISIDYKSLRRTVTAKEVATGRLDPHEAQTLESCLNMLRRTYDYDFTKLVSRPGVIAQIFLYNDHEHQSAPKDSARQDELIPNSIKLVEAIPTIHAVYSAVAKYRTQFAEKIADAKTPPDSDTREDTGSRMAHEYEPFETTKFPSPITQRNAFKTLAKNVHTIFAKNDVLLNISILKLNKASVREVVAAIKPVLNEAREEILNCEVDYSPWIRIFRRRAHADEPDAEAVHRTLNAVLDLSSAHGLHALTDLVVDVMLSFALRCPDVSRLIEALHKYFRAAVLPATLHYAADLSAATPNSHSHVFMPSLPNMEAIMTFEYLAMQYPLISRPEGRSNTRNAAAKIPSVGTFVVRLDFELLDIVDYNRLYRKQPDQFNFKLELRNLRRDDETSLVVRSHGTAFFVSDPDTRIFNAGSNFLSLEMLFSEASAVVFANGKQFRTLAFEPVGTDFFLLEFTYNLDNVNLRQFCTLSPGFKKYLIKQRLIHQHILVNAETFTLTLAEQGGRPAAARAEPAGAEPGGDAYIRRVFDHLSLFAMALGELHTALANVNFNVSWEDAPKQMNSVGLDAAEQLFGLTQNVFELVADLAENVDLIVHSLVGTVNFLTLWRLLSEAILGALSVVRVLLTAPVNAGALPLEFLSALSQIVVRALKYSLKFKLDDQVAEYHHPVELLALSNAVQTTAMQIVGANDTVVKQLFSTAPVHVLRDVLASIARTDPACQSDLKMLRRNQTLTQLDKTQCIEIFTKRALLHLGDAQSGEDAPVPAGTANLWWSMIYEMLEADRETLECHDATSYDFCTCGRRVEDIALLDPTLGCCVFCMRKHLNYFAAAIAFQFNTSTHYLSGPFYSIPRSSMLLSNMLLKHGVVIMLFTAYCSKYKLRRHDSAGSSAEAASDLGRQLESIDSSDSATSSLFEDYYMSLFEPSNLKLIEGILVYLLKTKQHVLRMLAGRVELLSRLIPDCFGVVVHNYIRALSLMELLAYFAEFMEAVRTANPYQFHLVCFSSLNLLPHLVKVVVLYNKILGEYTARYKKFTGFVNFLVHQFATLLVVLMKLVHFVYLNVDQLECTEFYGADESEAAAGADPRPLKDPEYALKFPKCATAELNFEFEETPQGEMGICESIRRLLVLVQDFKYERGASLAFRNIAAVEAFMERAPRPAGRDNALPQALLDMEQWALDEVGDLVRPSHAHLARTQYALVAVFVHLLAPRREAHERAGDSLDSEAEKYALYGEAIRHANQAAMRIVAKCQALNTAENVRDREKVREAYLEDVRARCAWLVANSKQGHYAKEHKAHKRARHAGAKHASSKVRTKTLRLAERRDGGRGARPPRRASSRVDLTDASEDPQRPRAWPLRRSKSAGAQLAPLNVHSLPERKDAEPAEDAHDLEDVVEFLLNGPPAAACQNEFVRLRLTWLTRIALLATLNAVVYNFLDRQYTNSPPTFRHGFRPLIYDLIMGPDGRGRPDSPRRAQPRAPGLSSMGETLEVFWYVVLRKTRSIVLATMRDANFERARGTKAIANAYARAAYERLCGILEHVCDWYIRSGVTGLNATLYTKVNMNFWLGASLSFFAMLYALGVEPMTDTRYAYQIFSHLFATLHPLPMASLKQAMTSQTSLSGYTVELGLVFYVSDHFTNNFRDTLDAVVAYLKSRKLIKKDQEQVLGGTLYLFVRRTSKVPETREDADELEFRRTFSLPRVGLTSGGSFQCLAHNFDAMGAGAASPSEARRRAALASMRDNDLIFWEMINHRYVVTEMALSKKSCHNREVRIDTAEEVSVFLSLGNKPGGAKTSEIELALVNYLGGSLEVEGMNGTWSQVVGFTRFDDLYKMRTHLYHLLKYLLWVELGTNLYTATPRAPYDNIGLVLKIVFEFLRTTAAQIFDLDTGCNCKDKTDNVSIKYNVSSMARAFKADEEVTGYLVDGGDYHGNPLVSRSCSVCSSSLIYRKEMDFFWGELLASLTQLVSRCENHNLVYLVLHSLVTTFTLGERQVQAFLSMEHLGQRFCNLLVVAIKQLSSTLAAAQAPASATPGQPRFGLSTFTHLKTPLVAPKIHGVFILKWLPPLKQVPLECLYATLRQNFQSVLVTKPYRQTTNIEPNDPFVTLPHSENFVTHRTSADFEADIAGSTLQVIRALNLGGIVMYRIPQALGVTAAQITTNFYILNASRFGITVAPADCVFGSVTDLFERNDVVGFSHAGSAPFTSQIFAATIGYSLGDMLTAHFAIDHQDDGQLCLRTELLIGGNSIGSVLEVIFDPITQNDVSRRMSLVFIFLDPATILLQGTNVSAAFPEEGGHAGPAMPTPNLTQAPTPARSPPQQAATPNLRSSLQTPAPSGAASDDPTTDRLSDSTASAPGSRSDSGRQMPRLQISSNAQVVRALDRLVSRETSGTIRTSSVVEHSIPVSREQSLLESDPELGSSRLESDRDSKLEALDEDFLIFSYADYFGCGPGSGTPQLHSIPQWNANFDVAEPNAEDDVPLTLCKDEFWDKLLRDDKYTSFVPFADSVQIYQSVLSVNVPMFAGLKHELVAKVVAAFAELHALLSSNFKYAKLEAAVRDCFSWLCVLCCEHDREAWDRLCAREFKVVSDFGLAFMLGSSFPARTPLVTLSSELLLDLLVSVASILSLRTVTSAMNLCANKRGAVHFMHGDVQTDALILTIGSKCVLASALILKVLAHRAYRATFGRGVCSDARASASQERLRETVLGLIKFAGCFLWGCADHAHAFSNTTDKADVAKLEATLAALGLNVGTLNSQASYKTRNNALQSVDLLRLDDTWKAIFASAHEGLDALAVADTLTPERAQSFNVKMFATADKHYHSASRIPAARRHFMRRAQQHKLVEHDVFDMLQALVAVFPDHFADRLLVHCPTTLSFFRTSMAHFARAFDPNGLDYWEAGDLDPGGHTAQTKAKVDLFSRAADPLYAWQLVFYSPFESGRAQSAEDMAKLLVTELVYSVALAINSLSFVRLLEGVFWILDTLVRHTLCPHALRRHLTSRATLNLLAYLFAHGVATPPKLAMVAARVTHRVAPALSAPELERLLTLLCWVGTSAYVRIHSVCNFYASSDLDLFTNFDLRRHDHATRLATANVMHALITAFALVLEELAARGAPAPNLAPCNQELAEFCNMGVYLYLARNKRLTKHMFANLVGLPLNVAAAVRGRAPRPAAAQLQNAMTSFKTFGPMPTSSLSAAKFAAQLSGADARAPGVYLLSCASRFFGLLLSFSVRAPTRFVFSQYRDFSKVFAELVVAPTKSLDLKPGELCMLEESPLNVPFTRYKLALNPRYTYRAGYTRDGPPQAAEEAAANRVYAAEDHAYLLTSAAAVEMYVRNGHVFWQCDGRHASARVKDAAAMAPFLQVVGAEAQPKEPEFAGTTNRVRATLSFELAIPVNTCFVKQHETRFEPTRLGGGCVVTPPIRTGLSVHDAAPAFENVTPIDLKSSALVSLTTDLLANLRPDETLRFDPCLPFRASFKFERGFDELSAGFYVGLVSRSEKLVWFSNGDLFVATNFHVPCRPNEYRKLRCVPYSERDVISVTFDPKSASLFFANSSETAKLNFFNYYYHITNVHTNNLINANRDAQTSRPAAGAAPAAEADGDLRLKREELEDTTSDPRFTVADRRSLINAIIFDDMAKIKSFLEFSCELFENGCDDHFDLEGDEYFLFSPIYIVANLGKLSILKLIATNKSINFDAKSGPFQTTPLMGAVKAGHYNVVYYLLTMHSLDVNALDAIGNNCLYYAINGSKNYEFKVAELLLNFGVRVQPANSAQSVLDFLENIPGSCALHRKILDMYKLQTLAVRNANWPLLQNLQVFMSSKSHVKFNIKVDPPQLGPARGQQQTSPGFQSPERRQPQPGDVLEMMGNFLGSIGGGLMEGISTTVDRLADETEQFIKSVSPTSRTSGGQPGEPPAPTAPAAAASGPAKEPDEEDPEEAPQPPWLHTQSVREYILESTAIIRRTLYKIANGADQMDSLTRTAPNESELTPKELIGYYLANFVRGMEEQARENKLVNNFVILTNGAMQRLENVDSSQILLTYINYENDLVEFGVVESELRFCNRLERSGQLLLEHGVLDSFAEHNGNFVYITTNEGLMRPGAAAEHGGGEIALRATGDLYAFDELRAALNHGVTFENDRCLESLVDLVQNSNEQLATLVRILVLTESSADVQRHLPPPDSELWSNISMTPETIYAHVREMRARLAALARDYPLSHVDVQLLYAVVCNATQGLDALKNAKVDANAPVEHKLEAILEAMELAPPEEAQARRQGQRQGSPRLDLNYRFNFAEESRDNAAHTQSSLSIRALSSPHLINRIERNSASPASAASQLYRDIINNNLSRKGSSVFQLNPQPGQDPGAHATDPKRDDKGLETHRDPDGDGHRDGGSPDPHHLLHYLSIVLVADRLKYHGVLSDVFRNVIPVVSTCLNQPKIEYRPLASLLSQPPAAYFGEAPERPAWSEFGVAIGPSAPVHLMTYLKVRPLIRRTTVNEMQNGLHSLNRLNADRPYFSIRVDRGIAHTTKLLRNSMWFQSTHQILNCNPNILRARNNQRPFMVVFKGEGSTDFGGPFQELLTCISNEFMAPLAPDNDSEAATIRCQNTVNSYGMHQDTVLIKYAHCRLHKLFYAALERADPHPPRDRLFTLGCCDLGATCSSGCCSILRPLPLEQPTQVADPGAGCRCGASELYSETCSQRTPMELGMYESLGRLCAMCVCMKNPLNVAINPIVWKKLMCANLRLIDLLDCDKMSVDLLQRLGALEGAGAAGEGDLDGLVFSLEGAEGAGADLVEGGADRAVAPDNLADYLRLATLFRLSEGDLGCSFMARGINSVLPLGRLRTLLDARGLEFVVCGSSVVDLAVLRAHTVSYSVNLKRDLFNVLARFNNDMLQLFLRFVSGRSRLPHPKSDWCLRLDYDSKSVSGGSAQDANADERLPTSATCSFRLLMPRYSSLDVMHRRLIYAIENCIAIDLDAHVVHDEMQLSIN